MYAISIINFHPNLQPTIVIIIMNGMLIFENQKNIPIFKNLLFTFIHGLFVTNNQPVFIRACSVMAIISSP